MTEGSFGSSSNLMWTALMAPGSGMLVNGAGTRSLSGLCLVGNLCQI